MATKKEVTPVDVVVEEKKSYVTVTEEWIEYRGDDETRKEIVNKICEAFELARGEELTAEIGKTNGLEYIQFYLNKNPHCQINITGSSNFGMLEDIFNHFNFN